MIGNKGDRIIVIVIIVKLLASLFFVRGLNVD